MNQITICGRIGKQPELRNTSSGMAVCTFSLCTTDKYVGKDGEKKEDTQWHRCVAYGKQAEVINQYVNKGDMFLVSGKMKYGQYEKDGNMVNTADVVVKEFTFIGGGKKEGGAAPARPQPAGRPVSAREALRQNAKQAEPAGDEDIPF